MLVARFRSTAGFRPRPRNSRQLPNFPFFVCHLFSTIRQPVSHYCRFLDWLPSLWIVRLQCFFTLLIKYKIPLACLCCDQPSYLWKHQSSCLRKHQPGSSRLLDQNFICTPAIYSLSGPASVIQYITYTSPVLYKQLLFVPSAEHYETFFCKSPQSPLCVSWASRFDQTWPE